MFPALWPKNAMTVGPTGGSRSCLICKNSFSGTSLGEGCYLFTWFLFLHSLLMPFLEKGYWTAGTFILAVFMLPAIFVIRLWMNQKQLLE